MNPQEFNRIRGYLGAILAALDRDGIDKNSKVYKLVKKKCSEIMDMILEDSENENENDSKNIDNMNEEDIEIEISKIVEEQSRLLKKGGSKNDSDHDF